MNSSIAHADVSLLSCFWSRNLGVIFDSTLSMFNQIRGLSRIRTTLYLHTTKIIATAPLHSSFDYWNSLFLGFSSYSSLFRQMTVVTNKQTTSALINLRISTHQENTQISSSLYGSFIISKLINASPNIIALTYKTLLTQQPQPV
jgi:hypothetical protein